MVERPWIVLPALNEAPQIEAALLRLRSYLPFIVVVDRGSSDDTVERARNGGAVVLMHGHPDSRDAVRTGLVYAVKQGATHVGIFAATSNHDPATIELMLATMRERNVAVVLGSRYLDETTGRTLFTSVKRRIAVGVAYILTSLPLTDLTNDARLFTRRAAETFCFEKVAVFQQIALLRSIARAKLAYAEVSTIARNAPGAASAAPRWATATPEVSS